MRVLRWIFVGLLLAACSPNEAGNADDFIATRLFAMGTWVDVTLRAHGEPADRDAIDALEAMLRRVETDYYAWGNGELADLNAHLSRGETTIVSTELAALLETSRTLSAKSGGRFDPGVGDLVELWGFHSSLATAARPSDDAIARWLARRPSISQILIENSTVSASSTGIKLDLGGIAKGEIVDRMLAELLQRGYADALVNAGGDLRVLGTRGERAWQVGIQAPRAAGILGTVRLASGEAVFTSGDYERFIDSEGERLHHLLDPSTGRPAMHTQAVTVVAGKGALADAAATAIFVAGPLHWREVADALDVAAVLRVDASGTIELTDAMRARLELSDESPPATVVGRS